MCYLPFRSKKHWPHVSLSMGFVKSSVGSSVLQDMCLLSLTVLPVNSIMPFLRFIPIFWISLRAWNGENEVAERNNLNTCS